MCGSLLSKFKPSNKVAPATRTDSLETEEFPGRAKLADEPTEVQISSPVQKTSDRHEDTGVEPSERTRKCAEDWKSESKAEEKAVESAEITVTAESPVAHPRKLPPLYRPTVDIKKVKEVVAKDMARLKKVQAEKKLAKEKLAREKLENENLVKVKFSKEQLAQEKPPKEKLAQAIEKLAKEQLMKELEAIQGGRSSSSSTVATKPISSARARSILLGKTKSAIAFEGDSAHLRPCTQTPPQA